MSTDVFAIEHSDLGSARLVGFKGVEALGRPFEFELFFTVPAGTAVKGAIGTRATLIADRGDDRGPLRWHGVLVAIRLLHETAERALYRASLVPKLWLLSQHVRSYVHTKKQLEAFVGDTLKDARFTAADYAFHTAGQDYPEEEFVCQYRESHLDFIHRWLEREGLYYYFEHGQEGAEKLFIVDDKAQHEPLVGSGRVRYAPTEGQDGSAGECLRELHADYRILPGSVLLSDYNYANPSAPVLGEKRVSSEGQGQIREYGYRVFTEGEAGRLAAVKAQSLSCRELVVTASGDALGLRAGYTFEVEDIPAELPAQYLAIEVRHAGAVGATSPLVRRLTGLTSNETYRVDVVAIPANVQYRSPQVTPWPRIYGFENGTVSGPAESSYAQIDEQGRYLIRLKFDASDLPDGATSTYVRMMQPHGGSTEGFHFPLRKGTEVMVSFQGGDPDRPVIAGVVPNALKPSNVTQRNLRQNVLRSGGGNFLVMDDTADSQYIDMGTPGAGTRFYMGEPDHDPNFIGPPEVEPWPPKSVTIPPADPANEDEPAALQFSYFMSTEGCAGFDVGGSFWQHVGGGMTVDVTSDTRIRYGGAHTFIVGGKADEFYQAGLKQVITSGFEQNITGNGEQNVEDSWTQNVTARFYGHYGESQLDVDSAWQLKAGANIVVNNTKGNILVKADAGQITLDSPTKITLKAPDIDQVTGKWYQTFGSTIAAGIHKLDITDMANAITNLSTAQTIVSVAVTNTKIEASGYEAVKAGAKLEGTPLAIARGAVRFFSVGLLKL